MISFTVLDNRRKLQIFPHSSEIWMPSEFHQKLFILTNLLLVTRTFRRGLSWNNSELVWCKTDKFFYDISRFQVLVLHEFLSTLCNLVFQSVKEKTCELGNEPVSVAIRISSLFVLKLKSRRSLLFRNRRNLLQILYSKTRRRQKVYHGFIC